MLGFTFMVEPVEESDRIFFENLYKKYNRLMFSTANRYCSKLCDCEDIVQDSVVNLCSKVKLLRNLPSYALPSYICYTVKNTAISHYRHQLVIEKHLSSLDGEMEAQIIPPLDYVLLSDLKVGLSKVWARLPERDQELLFRKYVFGESTAELANVFHCREDNIRMRLTRARRRAAKLIEEEGIYEQI